MSDSEAPATAQEAEKYPARWRRTSEAPAEVMRSRANPCLGKPDGAFCEEKTINGVTYRVFCLSQSCSDVFEKL
jgi:hypothetical protein